MEPVHGTNKASKSAASEEDEDFINRMPENVITHILDRLPLRDAMRTSILSRNWRFKWTLLTQLIFDFDFFDSLPETYSYDWRIIISWLLIHIKGPITKFVLNKTDDTNWNVEDITHWLMSLSRIGIKDLTLTGDPESPYNLPTHLFSCLELKHLMLKHCSICPPPTFYGFPNLLSLYLVQVTDIDNCMEIITKCPLLEILTFLDNITIGKVKLVEIAKLKNLKKFHLPLRILNVTNTRSAIFQLGGYLPKLEDLSLNFLDCKFIEEAGVRKWACTAFPCLKNLSLSSIDLSSGIMLSCAFEMIWGSPNLQTLSLNMTAPFTEVDVPPPAFGFPEVENNTMLQLQGVLLYNCKGLENEVYLIKYLLACSPLLKRIIIYAESSKVFGGDNGRMFATKLLGLHRASPIAEVKLYWH